MADPAVLLLDEPGAGMGHGERDELAAAIRMLSRDHGLSIVLIDHDMPLIGAVCNIVHVLVRGSVLTSGTPDGVFGDQRVRDAYAGSDGATKHQQQAEPAVEGVMEMTTCLELDDLHVAYGELNIVKGVSLRVEQGEFLALLGANGAGKTTLLSAIAGLKRRLPARSRSGASRPPDLATGARAKGLHSSATIASCSRALRSRRRCDSFGDRPSIRARSSLSSPHFGGDASACQAASNR